MSTTRKLWMVAVLIAVGLLASVGLSWPTRTATVGGFSLVVSGKELLGLIMVGLASTGTEAMMRSHPKAQTDQVRLSFLQWLRPSALVSASWALLTRLDGIPAQIACVLATVAALLLLILTEYYVLDPSAPWCAAAQFFLQLAAYPLATLLYIAIDLSQLASPVAGIAVAVVSATLGLTLLHDPVRRLRRTLPYVLGLGTLLGALSCLLDLWIASPARATDARTPLIHALALVVPLYVLAGVIQHQLSGRLTRKVAIEYLVVGIVALLLLLSFTR